MRDDPALSSIRSGNLGTLCIQSLQLNPSDQPATRLADTASYISATSSPHRDYANISDLTRSCTDMEGSTWLEMGVQ
jgi:hypothetical protein